MHLFFTRKALTTAFPAELEVLFLDKKILEVNCPTGSWLNFLSY